MKAETIKEFLLSGKYDTMSVADFAQVVREIEKEAEDAKMAEEEKYAKQVERARDIHERQVGNRGSYEKEDAFSDDVYEREDEAYDKASSNAGEQI